MFLPLEWRLTSTRRHTMDSRRSTMAMRDVTELMNAYRECSRNLWNIYFSRRANIGGCLDAFGHIRRLLFDSLVVSELFYEGEAEGEDIPLECTLELRHGV